MSIKRYSYTSIKYPREVVLLQSTGCSWGHCTFCDYQEEKSTSIASAAKLNRQILRLVTGKSGVLQIIDSASFNELPMDTLFDVLEICKDKNIRTVILEQHWSYRSSFKALFDLFSSRGVQCLFLGGIESFDPQIREALFNKGIGKAAPEEIRRYFQWVNLLCGVRGQSLAGVLEDIRIGLALFDRILLNIFIQNSSAAQRDEELIAALYAHPEFSLLKANSKIEVLEYGNPFSDGALGGIGYAEEEISG